MGGFGLAYNAFAGTVGNVWPKRHPAFSWLLGIGALGVLTLDVAAEKYASKPLPEDKTHERLMALYDQELAKYPPRPAVTVNVVNQPVAAAAMTGPVPPPSRYMMEEGNPDIKTDCFSCASAHLAATKAALERARGAVKDGECEADCRQWLSLAADESAALLSWDWTDERISQLPDHQQKVLAPRKAQVDALFNDLMGTPQAAEITKAKTLLGESVRFTNSGDPIDHPEVYGRLKLSEESLAAAERLDITAFDADTANKLRSVRQAVGSRVDSPAALRDTYKGTREVSGRVNDQVFATMTPADLDSLARRADGIWSGFKQDRLRVGGEPS